MSLYPLTDKVSHDAPRTSLDLLTTATDNLTAQYNSFLLSVQIELSPATLQDYRYKLRYFIDFCRCSGISSIKDINKDLARAFIACNQNNLKPASVSGYFKVAKRFLNWLVEEERLGVNPIEKMKAPRVPEIIIKPFNAEHIRKIMLLCEDGRRISIRNRAMVLVLLDTGVRLSELANILVSDIDIQLGIITVMGKGAKQRVVGISRATVKAVIKYYECRPGNHPQLWLTEEGKPLTTGGVGQIFRKTFKQRAGFPDVRLSAHTFRHTSGTMELLNGASEREVQLLLGHSTPRMTRHYTATITSMNVVGRHKDFSPVSKLRLK
jgi:site-specific recombinase XerD